MKKVIFILYGLFLLLFAVFSYGFVDPNLTFLKNIYTGFSFDRKTETTIIYSLFVVLFFIFYVLFLSVKNKLDMIRVKTLIVLTIATLFLSYPAMLSYDIFNYLTTAKVLFFYHENPYLVMPIEFISEPFLSFTRAANKIALYGPLWEIISGIPYWLGFGNFVITLFSFKLFAILFYIGAISLIYKISKNYFSVLFFALNPLVIMETLIGAHNDIVMMFFVLLSFLFVIKKRFLLSLIFLILSIFIKYATIFLIPVYAYIFWKQYVNKKEINIRRVFYLSFMSMLLIFFLSPVREEIYPWYGIWFLTFASLIPEKKFVFNISLIFSLSLLLRYIPFLYSGTYIGQTPMAKTIITFSLPIFYSFYYAFKYKLKALSF